MHQETKTKLSSATPNRDKTIHCQRKHRKHPAASNVAAEHLTHAMLRKPTTTRSKQFQTTWRFGKDGNMQAGQPCSPESCHSGTLAKEFFW